MKIMAVDFGDARTGLAICDRGELLASPAGVIQEKHFPTTVQKVAQQAQELDAQLIVVGHPLNMDGSCGDRAKLCEEFADKLRELVTVPVELWDERQTTVSAIGYLNETNTRGKKRKQGDRRGGGDDYSGKLSGLPQESEGGIGWRRCRNWPA